MVATIVIIAMFLLVDWWVQRGHRIESNAILAAILPVLIWLMVSGKITSFKAFGVELKSAINVFSRENIYADSDPLASGRIDYEAVDAGEKAAPSQIPIYIRRGISALSFQLGRKGYYDANLIAQWFANDFFKWVIFVDEHGQFQGFVPSTNLRAEGDAAYEALKQKVENNNVRDLPGFVGQESALTTASTKGEAIEKFSNFEANDLPVVRAADRKFVGVLNRAKLNSKLLATIFHAARTSH